MSGVNKIYREGAKGALLDEYEKAIAELKQTLTSISDQELIIVADNTTQDPDCRSVQTILSHVVRAGFNYAINIRKLKGHQYQYADRIFHETIKEYISDLDRVFIFTVDTFEDIPDNGFEQFENSKKILTSWGQIYDIEQMMEHAIVHILRHRRQIEKFKILLRDK
ncbi:MAG: DinB family protein [Chitinophagales bacterium]|nr:DinB family protein [Chitinophagales bacterium]